MSDADNLIQSEIDNALFNFKNANYHEAIKILEKLKKKQTHFIIYWYLGHSYFRIYNYSSAIECIKKSIELKEPDTLNLNFLAEIFLASNDYKEAIKVLNKILEKDKNNAASLFKLAKIYLEIGELEKAEKYFNEAVKCDPTNFEIQYELSKINKKYLTADLLKNLEKKQITQDTNNLNNVFSKLIIAENCKNNKNFESELGNLTEAHNLYLQKRERAANQEFNYFTNLLPKFISKTKDKKFKIDCDLKPIFIMGLPRSGSTLIESVISSNNDKIEIGGEVGAISKVFYSENIISNYDLKELKFNFNFKKEDFEKLKFSILKQYQELKINTNNDFFTDKSLENFLYIELISKIFPKAKFVYCKRNKYANFLGILKVFLPNLLWSHSTQKIINIMNLYENNLKKIINENKIKIKIIELENFSNNPIDVSKDLFNFLGIDWNNKILENAKSQNKRIQTVSNLQVRKKISKHDLAYLDDYFPFLHNLDIEKLV